MPDSHLRRGGGGGGGVLGLGIKVHAVSETECFLKEAQALDTLKPPTPNHTTWTFSRASHILPGHQEVVRVLPFPKA